MFYVGVCKSLAPPRNYQLFSVKGVAKHSQSHCRQLCSERKKALAVPMSRAEYQCMIATASTTREALSGRSTPFWTGLLIDSQNRLTGIVNGTNYTGLDNFGEAPWHQAGKSKSRGKFLSRQTLHVGDGVYISDKTYVTANDSAPLTGSAAIHCMCQGENHSHGFRDWLVLVTETHRS